MPSAHYNPSPEDVEREQRINRLMAEHPSVSRYVIAANVAQESAAVSGPPNLQVAFAGSSAPVPLSPLCGQWAN